MKNNLISAIAGWKSAALLALVAMVAAVAFSGVLSSGQTAEAAEVTLTGTTVDAQPGDTVVIPNPSGGTDIVRFTIDTANSTSTGSFDSGGEQVLSCSDTTTGTGCDTDTDADEISVKLNIDADSADGYIIVKRDSILPIAGTDDSVVITVTTQPKPASLTVKAENTTIAAAGGTGGTTEIMITVKNDQSPSVGMNGQVMTVQTNLGVLSCLADNNVEPALPGASNAQWCQVATISTDFTSGGGAANADGRAIVTLSGTGLEGTATITVTHPTLGAQTAEVTLYGTAKNLSAEAEQTSVEVGGSVFVVLTVTDAVGNPVRNAQPQPAAKDPIVGPSKDPSTIKVTTRQAADDGNAATSPYNVNKDVDGDGTVDKGDIPACGPVAAVTANPDADPPVVGVFASTGTNNAGQCVVQVHAPPDDTTTTTNEAATRGVHTLNFALGTLKASAEVTVAGPAASIESKAPESVEPLSDTTITVTVRDEDGVLVGATAINVIKVAGAGLAEGKATESGAMTVNGSSTFSYAAGLEGQIVFRVIAGSGPGAIRDVITLTVGEPPAPEPEGPAPTWNNPLFPGQNLVSWQGEDGADPSAGASEGVIAIWSYNAGTGQWDGYFVEAADVPGGTTLTSLTHGDAYFVIVE